MNHRLICRVFIGSLLASALAPGGVLPAAERAAPAPAGARYWGASEEAAAGAGAAFLPMPAAGASSAPVIRGQSPGGYYDPADPVPVPGAIPVPSRPVPAPATVYPPPANPSFTQTAPPLPAAPAPQPFQPQPFQPTGPGFAPPGGAVLPGMGGAPLNGLGPTEDGGPLIPPGGFVQPFGDDGIGDLDVVVQETQTGRFSVGVGVNSDAGVLGNIVLDEQNFSATRFPRYFGETFTGNAFRGDGQHFRAELVPGNEVQRYTVSFSEPYLFDTPVSFGLNGFYFTRFYEDWREQRMGGSTSLGYQVRPDLSISGTLRAEQVRLTDPRQPAPPEVLDVLGETNLYTAKVSLVNDTRDSAFLPTQGHMIELAYEQGFGEFDFPRGSVDVRQYFLITERPDRSGRHVLSLRGRVGIEGSNAPVYERYFIGGFSTLRGFNFRGASPVAPAPFAPVTVGGNFMVLTSAEYLLPITADDSLRMVFFVDAGTVEEKVELHADTFRVAPGFGLRISVPGMGPAPIALDFAFPVNKADTDDTRVFSFFVGLLR
jgi:outer membrane protein insertion porin family